MKPVNYGMKVYLQILSGAVAFVIFSNFIKGVLNIFLPLPKVTRKTKLAAFGDSTFPVTKYMRSPRKTSLKAFIFAHIEGSL